jgi:hypothetical protein
MAKNMLHIAHVQKVDDQNQSQSHHHDSSCTVPLLSHVGGRLMFNRHHFVRLSSRRVMSNVFERVIN